MGTILIKRFRALKGVSVEWMFNFSSSKSFSKDPGKEEDANKPNDEPRVLKKGVPSSKQQSIQEESYFNKLDSEQLKDLKKKVQNENKDKNE